MKKHLLLIVFLLALCTASYSQIDDVFDKTKDKVEEEIKKKQKEKEKKEKEKKEKEQTEKESPDKLKDDTGFVSNYHRMHKGEIAFSKDVDMDLSREVALTDAFAEKDVITACVYMEKRIDSYRISGEGVGGKHVDMANDFIHYYVKCFIDGSEFDPQFKDRFSKGDVKAFTLRLQGSMGILTNASGFWDRMNKLTPGNHTVRIEVWGGDPDITTAAPIAKGEYTYIKDAPPPVVLKRFSAVEVGMRNAKLESDAIEAINRRAERENWKERYSKAVINSYDWQIERTDFGIITHRLLFMTLYGVWPDGSCKMTECSFSQNYDGSRFSDVLQQSGIGAMWDVECE